MLRCTQVQKLSMYKSDGRGQRCAGRGPRAAGRWLAADLAFEPGRGCGPGSGRARPASGDAAGRSPSLAGCRGRRAILRGGQGLGLGLSHGAAGPVGQACTGPGRPPAGKLNSEPPPVAISGRREPPALGGTAWSRVRRGNGCKLPASERCLRTHRTSLRQPRGDLNPSLT